MSGLHADLGQLAIVHTDELTWQPSPSPTVWRKRLELRGDAERGRVTSVVRYDRGSAFPPHDHPEGEEILVLDGVFSDEHGDFPAGTYLLNPPGFRHAPFSREGCVIFVKLRQYAGADRTHVVVDARRATWEAHEVEGASVLPLYAQPGFPEEIELLRVQRGTEMPRSFPGGGEIFLLSGSFADEHGSYRARSWVRYPAGAAHHPVFHADSVLYLKTGHL